VFYRALVALTQSLGVRDGGGDARMRELRCCAYLALLNGGSFARVFFRKLSTRSVTNSA
jgi:hypothetical protein